MEPSKGALPDEPKIAASSKSTSMTVLEYHHSPSKMAFSTRLVCTWSTWPTSDLQAPSDSSATAARVGRSVRWGLGMRMVPYLQYRKSWMPRSRSSSMIWLKKLSRFTTRLSMRAISLATPSGSSGGS